MGALISQISGSLGKAVMSTFFPVVLFLFAFYVGVLPLYPYGLEIFRPFEGLDPGWKALAFSFCAMLLTGVLFNMNTLVYRLFEGYPWRYSVLGRWCTERQVKRFKQASRCKSLLLVLVERLPEGSTQANTVGKRLGDISRILEKSFPDDEDLVLPTRFGNVVRAFEVYPRRQYQMAAIELWPRLLAVVDATYSSVTNDAKTIVDFLLNASLLAAVLSYSTLLLGLRTVTRGLNPPTAYWLLRIAGFAGLSYWFYASAIAPAQDWGQHVRSAFDLFRSNLLSKLGITATPATLQEERRIWHSISDQIVFPNAVPLAVPLRVSPPAAFSENGVAVTVVRSVKAKLTSGSTVSTPIQLTVKNATSTNAVNVVVTDNAPTQMEYLDQSLRPTGQVSVRRSDPLEFTVMWVPAHGCVTFQYEAITPGS
jgi:hypothetical protein